jgi:transmembrane sensor
MKDKYQQLILNSLMEDVSEEQDKELSLWLGADIRNRNRFEATKRAWNKSISMSRNFNPNTEVAWKKIKSKINTVPAKNKYIHDFPAFYEKNSFSIIWKAAAIILVVIGIPFITLQVIEKNNNASASRLSETYSATSQKSFIQLKDGSKVWLNKNTTLICESNFNDQTRTVHLNGEAFFEVAKNPNKPFVILSGSTKTTILGTAFNLRAYKDESSTELVVVHGKVSFANNNSSGLILEKNDKGVINKKTGEAVKSINKKLNFLAWKDEKLFFDKTEFAEVKKDIESYFSIKMEVDSPAILKCYFTGTFEKPQLEKVLNVIQITMKINYKIDKDKIILARKNCY